MIYKKVVWFGVVRATLMITTNTYLCCYTVVHKYNTGIHGQSAITVEGDLPTTASTCLIDSQSYYWH